MNNKRTKVKITNLDMFSFMYIMVVNCIKEVITINEGLLMFLYFIYLLCALIVTIYYVCYGVYWAINKMKRK